MLSWKKKNDVLPLGSVVSIKREKGKEFIVIGRGLKDGTGRKWDYLFVPYPEGFMNEELAFFANDCSVSKVLFLGYQSPDEERVKAQLHAFVNEQESEHDRKKDG